MATKNRTPSPAVNAATHSQAQGITDPEMQKLRNTVEWMDCLSQDAFSKITTMARLALASLEAPDGHRHLDDIANALGAIWSTAEVAENGINYEAETVGCNYKDEAQRRRWAAARQAREETKEVQHG